MKLAIIGRGQAGTAIATALRRGGHQVIVGIGHAVKPVPLAEAACVADLLAGAGPGKGEAR